MKLFRKLRTALQLSQRVLELEDQVKNLEAALEQVDQEWSGWYDKFRALYGRLAKRVKDAEQLQEREESSQEAPPRPRLVPGAETIQERFKRWSRGG